ncbi:MAG: SGNH/GDSL hydrolase family protein [Deltaproteobacteria bacterium]|nr:SGNH/GDSL hydrolase family protein [Deltaproteobacteria bacterium]
MGQNLFPRMFGFAFALSLIAAGCTENARTGPVGGSADGGSGGTNNGGQTAGTASGGTMGTASGGTTVETKDAATAVDTSPSPDAAPATYQPCPQSEPCRILPFGDSITVGILTNRIFPVGGYRVQLFARSVEAGNDITFVGSDANGPEMVANKPFPMEHEGHNGWTINDVNKNGWVASGLSDLTNTVMRDTKPHIILLMAGTNDMLHVESEPEKAHERLGTFLDKIIAAAPNALLVVAQIIPTQRLDIKDNNADTNLRVQAYNAKIPALVAARAAAGKHIILTDMYGPYMKDADPFANLFTADPALDPPGKIHPNAAGYAVIGNTWFEAIKPHLR